MHHRLDFRGRAAIILLGLLLGACGNGERAGSVPEEPTFITTLPPLAMILEPMVAGRGSVEVLLKPGDSPHTHNLTPSDLREGSNGAVLVYTAQQLDGWAAELPGPRSLELADLLPSETRRSFGGDGPHAHPDTTTDPHFWTDPRAVASLLPSLTDTLCAIDAPGCSTYRANADSFATALTALDARLDSMMDPVREVPVLLAQPFFRYFLARYGPHLVGVIQPHPAKEPSPRRLQALVTRAKNQGVRAILTQRHHSSRAAEAVAEAAGLPLVALDPLGGAGRGTTYEDLLMHNAQLLLDALSERDT